jgi:hypothetical protein
MDNAVALVRAHLHVNGYFTVCEYPVLEAARRTYRTRRRRRQGYSVDADCRPART